MPTRFLLLAAVAASIAAPTVGAEPRPTRHAHHASTPPSATAAAPPAVVAPASVAALGTAARQLPSDEERVAIAEKRWEDRAIAWSTIVLAVATVALFVFTFLLWLATRRLVTDGRASAERQQRAYVTVKNAYAEWADTTPVFARGARVIVTTVNTGQTPAREVRTWMAVASEPPDWKGFSMSPPDGTESAAVQGAGQIAEMTPVFYGSMEYDDLDEWRAGRRSLFAYGRIEYRDVFGNAQYTCFRYVMPPDGMSDASGRFRACEGGNEAT